MSRILKTLCFSLMGTVLSTAAYAGCSNATYCNSNVGGWNTHQTIKGHQSSQQSSVTQSQYKFSGPVSSVAGLGQNESLQPTSCPVNVYNPNQGQVLGCYNVVKPVSQTHYYRIVRPVIYVHYPVPVAVMGYGHTAHASASAHSEAWSSGSHHSYGTKYPSATRYGSHFSYSSTSSHSEAYAQSSAQANAYSGHHIQPAPMNRCAYRCG